MSGESCEFPAFQPPDEKILEILDRYKSIAVVGLSKNPEKPSHFVPRYLKDHGYRIIPVNPTASEPLLGERVHPKLGDITEPVEVVNIFRPSVEVPAIVREAISIGAKAIWMQEGIVHNESAKEAAEAGLIVVMNRCMMKEHRRLKG